MVKPGWSSISLPSELMDGLDEFLDTEESKKIGLKSRSQIITSLIRKFFEIGPSIFENKSEIEEMKKIKREVEEMKKEIEIENKTGENLFNTLSELTEGKVEEIKNLTINTSKSGEMIINDPSLKKTIEIINKKEIPYCTYHKAHFCYHISFLSMNIVKAGMRALKEKHS